MTDTQPKAETDSQPMKWTRASTATSLQLTGGNDDERVFTDSGIEIDKLYEEEATSPTASMSSSGSLASTRSRAASTTACTATACGPCASTPGFSSAEDTNGRYRYLLEHGSTGLSMAFDLPTELGRDSDDPICEGEVGRTGVPIHTIEDMRICSTRSARPGPTSMTINAPAGILLLLYELSARSRASIRRLRGTVQNDVLKEYIARGTHLSARGHDAPTTDIFEYCSERVPKWNTISISGYHIREKGCSAVQEVAFTLSNAIAYTEAALDRGLQIDDFAGRLAFFFNCHNNVFQEIAKFRAARRMWAKIMRERFGASKERSQMIRFHTRPAG